MKQKIETKKGRPLLYGEQTVVLSGFHCPLSKRPIMEKLIRDTLKKWEKNRNTPKPAKTYEVSMIEWLDSFRCGECGVEERKNFFYDRTVANGEVWYCRKCNNQTMVSEEPKEENY